MLYEFSLTTLGELDAGRIAEAWNQAVMRATRDCEDRPAEKKPRQVNLQLELVPVFEQDGAVLDSIVGTFKVKDTVPLRQSKEYSFGVRKVKGQLKLTFNDLSDDNVHQRTIDQGEGD